MMSARLRHLTIRLACCLSTVCAAALTMAAPAPAVTPSTGWSIDSIAEPTIFNAADTTDQVETLTVKATSGTYELALHLGNADGTRTEGSPVVTETEVVEGVVRVGDTIAGTYIPPGTTIVALDSQAHTLTLSKNAEKTTSIGLMEADEITTPINWDASVAELQTALESLPAVGHGNIKMEAGTATATEHSYTISWEGEWSGTSPLRVEEEEAYTKANLVNGTGAGTVAVSYVQFAKALDRYTVTATNVGSVASTGAVTITDTLPVQLAQAGVVGARLVDRPFKKTNGRCGLTPPVTVTCEYGARGEAAGEMPVRPGDKLVMEVKVAVPSPSLTGLVVNEATVSGGGGATVSTSESTPVNAGVAAFGVDQFAFEPAGLAGEDDFQAGNHPYGVTTTISFNTVVPQEVKRVATYLPLGFVGDPLAAERCPEVDMNVSVGSASTGVTECTIKAPGSVVGEIFLKTGVAGGEATEGWTIGPLPVYNVVPEHGYPAELSFKWVAFRQPFFLYASVVPSAEGYRVRVATPGAPHEHGNHVERIALTVFGNPSAHDGESSNAAFLTNPTSCSGGPVKAKVEVSSWEGGSDSREATAYPQVTGCNLLQGGAAFNPSIKLLPEETPGLKPEETHADTPSGYEVRLKVPQAPNVFGQPATPELRDASVTLPAGLTLSPSTASGPNGPEGCTAAQIDLLGTEMGEGARNGSPYDDGETHASPGNCPEKSRIGEVEVKTPLLEEPLKGHVFLAQPSCGGPGQGECSPASASNGELFGIYLEMSGSGVIIKLHGKVSANPLTGQLTTTFVDNPQLPFDTFSLRLYNGPRAPLANPQTCGAARTTSVLEPWSAPDSGPDATPSWPLTVTGCANPMPFSPGFEAGTVQTLADGFSPFTMTLSRHDGEQDVGGVAVTLPPGLAGMISKVPLCGEAQANAGTCPEASRIGTARVAAGAGSEPLWLEGRVYLTGPYKGAPFGLSVVVPAKAGPFNLGNEVVRSKISIDPHTAQVTVASDAIPLLRDGVPFRLKAINVTVDRPGFTFNPTNCSQLRVTGSVTGDLPDGSPGATAAVSSPFAVAGCKNLPFKPGFSVSTSAKHSRARGDSLHVVVRSGAGQANIGKVHVALPKVLPSRLSTLKLACTAAQFATNPAGCPSGSFVGTATAHTPVLPVPLTGPAIFVSHGGAAFPDLDIVLQGDGVTVILTGNTFISKGITTSTFASVPDVPVTRFDLTLPAGPHSALGANGNLCYRTLTTRRRINGRVRKLRRKVAVKLVMPTTITGQNGAVVKRNTKITVAGCAKPKVNKGKPKRK